VGQVGHRYADLVAAVAVQPRGLEQVPCRQGQDDAAVIGESDEILSCASLVEVFHAGRFVQDVGDGPPPVLVEIDGRSAVERGWGSGVEPFGEDEVVPGRGRPDPPVVPVERRGGDLGVGRPVPVLEFVLEDPPVLANDSDGPVLKIDVPVLVQVSGDDKRCIHERRLAAGSDATDRERTLKAATSRCFLRHVNLAGWCRTAGSMPARPPAESRHDERGAPEQDQAGTEREGADPLGRHD
jgi:hypothetical protein